MYTQTVIDHFEHPRNQGEMPDANGIGEVGGDCGDKVQVFIKVENDVIVDIKFKTYGCTAAIASSSMGTEMAKGMNIAEAEKLTNEMVAEALGGLPDAKMHCSNLVADAIREAINDYKEQYAG